MGRVIPEEITELSMCEVFVFGSNLAGHHLGGAAKTAYEKFGAEWGVGSGPTGQCYAIPTMHGGLDDIKPYVDEFIEYARNHPNNRFLVTRVGCGIAGFTDEQMAPLFKEARNLPNVNFPKSWLLIIYQDELTDAILLNTIPKEKEIPLPDALTESDLKRLCEEYKYIIGSALIVPKPKIWIRYVLDTDKFGYASFGDFFMCEDGELYVWSYDENNELPHNQDMVELIFGDECKYRRQRKHSFHRVIFAGVETPFSDCYGNVLYSGDVLRVWLGTNYEKSNANMWAFGTSGENENGWKALYACVLDNHYVSPDMCTRIERCGTVFYHLSWDDKPIEIGRRCERFQPPMGDHLFTEEDKRILAKFTPNFNIGFWSYYVNEISGVEFDLLKNQKKAEIIRKEPCLRYGCGEMLLLPHNTRTYFDNIATEWGYCSTHQKLLELGYAVTMGYDISQDIKEMLDNHAYIHEDIVKDSLGFLMEELTGEDSLIIQDRYQSITLEVMIEDLKDLLINQFVLPYDGSKHYLIPWSKQVTHNDVLKANLWNIVADDCKDNEALYNDKQEYIYPGDADMIEQYNSLATDETRFVLNTVPCPFQGNPLTAKVIILSRNASHNPRVNNYFAKILQSNPQLAKGVMDFMRSNLRLDVHSFMPNDNGNKHPNYQDAFNMLGSWYWYDILSKWMEKGLTHEQVFNQVALIQSIPYASNDIKGLPKNSLLPSQIYAKKMIMYIANYTNTIFVVPMAMAAKRWKTLLGATWDKLEREDRIIIGRNPRKEYLTLNNLGENQYHRIIEHLKHG